MIVCYKKTEMLFLVQYAQKNPENMGLLLFDII